VAVSRNTAIPLAVAFGHVEDFELSQQFWSVFQEQFGIDLSSFILVSDQGSGLRKFAREHHFTHRLCLRHFLATLKDRTFSIFVRYIVKVFTEEELEILLNVYREPLHRALTRDPSDGMRRAQTEFKTAGLSARYPENERLSRIETIDVDRWEQVSSIVKTRECIPRTTNCLESINGHCNAETPRRNWFWASLARLGKIGDHNIGFLMPRCHKTSIQSRRKR
jgi:hypothetical protein